MRGRGSHLRRAATAAALLAVAFSVLPATAARAGKLDDLQRKIRNTEAKIRQANAKEKGIIAELNASDARRRDLERVIASLSDELTAATAELSEINAVLAKVQGDLAKRTRDLEETTGDLEDQKALFGQRSAQSYMEGPASFLDVVLNTEDFPSFVAGNEYIRSVLSSDVNTLQDIRDLKAQIEQDRASIDAQRAAVQKQADAAAQQQARIASLRQQQASARNAVLGEIGYRQRLLRQVRDEKSAYIQALQSFVEESNRIEALLRQRQRGQHVAGAGHGYLKWPVTGEITSGYGWRTHPIYGYRSFHTGIDIGAPYGAPVKSARTGRVISVTSGGAYGLMIVIDHGDSVATAYAHLSKVYVRTGEIVTTGETVAAVGCSGWCTGPHLHFEVRVAGEHQNPLLWL